MAKRANADGPVKGATLNLRIRPKIKYGLELLARRQHRSVAAAIETMAQKAVYAEFDVPPNGVFSPELLTSGVNALFDLLWAPTEAERLARLLKYAPDLMTYDDDRRWEVINETKNFWGGFLFTKLKGEELATRRMPDASFTILIPDGDEWLNGDLWKLIGKPSAPYDSEKWFAAGNLNFIDKNHARMNQLGIDRVEAVWTDLVKAANDEISLDEFQRIVDERKFPQADLFTVNLQVADGSQILPAHSR